ncbi:hypothetical protein CROQUDRAFT_130796 [Cronartium quercuum f. sp. fusiforme G11]|uniref:Uncharacterized protein n=1 Tax=Cronartium quercuum f. sp. fusiforme G11 TaxID=708437 RepID=A0A9P6TF33_9BASI|nr:hypothetical protein CROQUDRAFT_130796 [Cronartium quercuum f. sp. fusiforme G11]
MPSSHTHASVIPSTFVRHIRRAAPPNDPSARLNQPTTLKSFPPSHTQTPPPAAINLSTTISHGAEPNPLFLGCPTRHAFSVALDLPHQRSSHQNPAFLNSHFQQGCRCHWSSKLDEGKLDGLICDVHAHYYYRSESGAVIRGARKPLVASSHPSPPSPPVPDARKLKLKQEHLPSSAKPVIWAGHPFTSSEHPHPQPLAANLGKAADHRKLVPLLGSVSQPPNPVVAESRKPPVATHPSNPAPKPVKPPAQLPVPVAFPVPPASQPAPPVEHSAKPLVSDQSAKPLAEQRKSAHAPVSTLLANPTESKQGSVDRQTVNLDAYSAPHTSGSDGNQASSLTGTTKTSPGSTDTTPTVPAPPSTVTPPPPSPPLEHNAAANNNQMVYTPTYSALSANHTSSGFSPTSNNSNTLSSSTGAEAVSIPSQGPSNEGLAKALGGTFGGIIGLSLLLIAGVLLSRRRPSNQSRESFAGLRRSRHSSVIAPPMAQVASSGNAFITGGPEPSGSLMSPADPQTRYSLNGAGLLSKLQGTTASLQRAGLITPGSTEDAALGTTAAETIIPVSQAADPFSDSAQRDSVGTQAESIYNPFANENSVSADHHLGDDQRQSFSTELGVSSGEVEAVRFGSSAHNSDDLTNRAALRASGEAEQAWWGGL